MKKILLISDNSENLSSYKVMLQLEGFDVISSKTAGYGRKLALSKNPDLIILDITHPSGIAADLCESFKEWRNYNVIFFSTSGEQEKAIEEMRAVGYDCISMPYVAEKLVCVVRNALKNLETSEMSNFTFGSILLKPYSLVAEYHGKDLKLRPKEYSLLDLLCRNAGNYVSTDYLLRRVWNTEDINMQMAYNCLCPLKNKIADTDVVIYSERNLGYMAAMK